MKIKLLHAVLHDGHRLEAGESGLVDDDLAEALIASGAAEEIPEAEPAPAPVNDLPELQRMAETGDANPAAPAAHVGETGSAAKPGADAPEPTKAATVAPTDPAGAGTGLTEGEQPGAGSTSPEPTAEDAAEAGKTAKGKGSK